MRSRRLLPLVLVAFAATTLFLDAAQAQPVPAVQPGTRVAIVNPSRIFVEIKETAALREKLKVKQKDLANEETARRAEIDAMIKERDLNYNPKHPKYIEACKAIDHKKGDFQAWGSETKAQVEREQKLMLKDLYDKIETAVAQVAQQKGIDLVLADGRQDISSLEDVPAEELRRILNARTVIYASKAVDITETVIAVMDQQFAAGGGAVPPPVPTPAPVPH